MNRVVRTVVNLSLVGSLSLFLVSCSSKSSGGNDEYNQPALYWYNKMIKQVATGYIDDADDTYLSLQSEHKNSPLLATSMQIMAKAHIDEEEYALANYYLDEYIKRFALSKNIDYIRYLKIKANYLSFQYQHREQELISDTMIEIEKFLQNYPESSYVPLVQTINGRLSMAKASMDQEIADLYARIGKPKASEYYQQKVQDNWVEPQEIQPVSVPWYRAIFE